MATRTLLYTTRLRVGWKQDTLATYLGVTRTLLSMAEAGQRDLPMPAYVRLLQLVKLLPATQETTLPQLSQAENAQLTRQLANEVKEKTWQKARLQIKLAQLRERLQLLAMQRTVASGVVGGAEFGTLATREREFWVQRQTEVGRGQVADAYFEWLKATRALEVLTFELQLLQRMLP